MTLLTARQEALLVQVREANEALRAARRTADREAQIIVADRIAAFKTALDNAVRLAFAENIPQQKIGKEGLGTTDWKTVQRMLKRTEEVAEALAAANNPLAKRYAIDGNNIRVTLTRGEIEQVGSEWKISFDAARNTALFSAPLWFFVGDVAERLVNPVSYWMNSSEHKDELATWAREHFTGTDAVEAPVAAVGIVTELDTGDDDENCQ